MRPELKKTLTGKYVIKYDCPGCGDRLSSSLDDAGTRDTCPGCGTSFDVPGVAEKEKLAARTEYEQKKRQQEWSERSAEKRKKEQREQEAAAQRAKEASARESRQLEIDLAQEVLGNKYPFEKESYTSVVGVLSQLGMLLTVVVCFFVAVGSFAASKSVFHEMFGLVFVGYIVVICSVSVLTRVGWKIVVAQQATAKEASRTRAMIQDYLARQRDG